MPDLAPPPQVPPRAVTAWGRVGEEPSDEEVAGLARLLVQRFPDADLRDVPPPAWEDLPLAPPAVTVPAALAAVTSTDPRERLLHARGRSFLDLAALHAGDPGRPSDVVALPRDAGDVARVLDWCAEIGAACVPFGGGTSVVGGVTPPPEAARVVTLSTARLDRVLELDPTSMAARVQAGVEGPSLEHQLRPTGLTFRFFPQSFALSTVGGWIVTRAAGHDATGRTHVDDLVQSVTAVTPSGTWSSLRLPGSGAGPSPDRLLLGSEGILGVVTEAWLRLRPRPQHRAQATVTFPSFAPGLRALRAVAQSGLQPSNARLLDATEAALNGAGDGSRAVLLLGAESSWRSVTDDVEALVGLCRDAGGEPAAEGVRTRSGAAGDWKASFLRAPHLRDALLRLGMVVETFETAVTWDRADALVQGALERTRAAVTEVCGAGSVTVRTTHAYPDGVAPYFTVIAPGRRADRAAQWRAVKEAASEALRAAGGSITHHHAVGRDHRPWYDDQRPEPFVAALRAAKDRLDPAGVLNPGVLLDRTAR